MAARAGMLRGIHWNQRLRTYKDGEPDATDQLVEQHCPRLACPRLALMWRRENGTRDGEDGTISGDSSHQAIVRPGDG